MQQQSVIVNASTAILKLKIKQIFCSTLRGFLRFLGPSSHETYTCSKFITKILPSCYEQRRIQNCALHLR